MNLRTQQARAIEQNAAAYASQVRQEAASLPPDRSIKLKELPYADMGYLPDRRKRLPLGSRQEAWDAWHHMREPVNALLYSPIQLKRVFGRITRALRDFGVPADLAKTGAIAAVESAIEARRTELEQMRRTLAGGLPADKQLRLRTGLDDHLELGEYQRPKAEPTRAGPVVHRRLADEGPS